MEIRESRPRWRTLPTSVLLVALALPTPGRAQETAPSPGTVALREQAAELEEQIAALLQQRAGAAAPRLDLRIDLEIVQRWLLQRAADAVDEEAMRNAAALRSGQVRVAGEGLRQRLGDAARPLSSSESDGLAKLHQFTYKLPELKSVASLDEACKSLALDLILAAGPSQAEANHLPPMRPPPIAPGKVARDEPAMRDAAARIKSLNLSEPLRRALALANGAPADPRQRPDPDAKQTFGAALDLAEALERGVGIEPAARPKIEQRLVDALTLYGDPRTRPAGKARVEGLAQLTRSLAGAQRLKLPPALQEKLAPAIVWAGQSIEHGGAVLALIQQYAQLCARFDAIKDAGAASQRKVIDPLQRKFAAERSGFLEDAQGLSANAAAGPVSNLEAHVTQMGRLLDDLEAIQNLPRALQSVAALKPRPAGALERRASLAMTELSASSAAAREQAMRFVKDAGRLAQLAESLGGQPASVSPEILSAYTHGRFQAVLGKRSTIVADLATQLAAGRALDRTDFARVRTLADLLEALAEAAAFEAALAKVDELNRWADWSIPAARLKLMIDPYREATASAFEGFASDNSTPVGRWPQIHKTYAPLMAFVTQEAPHADACAKLPAGLFGELAKLMTPMSGQPYELERYASFMTGIWDYSSSAAELRSAEAALEALTARLKTDLSL